MQTKAPFEYRRLRAPREDGRAFIEPPLNTPLQLDRRNNLPSYDCQGKEFKELIDKARGEAVTAAREYTGRYLDVDESSATAAKPLIMAGHQPDLFHAGVWLKNFVLDSLARRHDALALNVLIDNDITSSPGLRIPTGSVADPRLTTVAIDRPGEAIPFESRPILDPSFFAGFAQRVQEAVGPLIPKPLVHDLWHHAAQVMEDADTNRDEPPNYGQVLARARHRLERDWGLNNLEVPLSHLADTQSFRWFACHLLAQLPRLWEIYNTSLREYRRIHRLRSRSHPVPDLLEQDDWLETPFWIWNDNQPGRQRLYARMQNDCLQLGDLQGIQFCLPLHPDRSAEEAVAKLDQLNSQGIRLRPRALVTTMYFRTLLSDAFIHGIGGAKYDQLTDVMLQRFFGFPAPSFYVVSGTFLLPVERPDVNRQDLRRLERQMRDLDYNPQRFLSDGQGRSFAEQKSRLLRDHDSLSPAELHRELQQLNACMQPLVEPARYELIEHRKKVVEQLRRRQLLSSREYSFCLFPHSLRQSLEILAKTP